MEELKEKALVTGASHGIGRAIAEMLVTEGYDVYGTGRTFDQPSSFHEVKMDLLDERELSAFLNEFDQKNLKIVVNNAGCAYYGLHEEMNEKKIREMVRLNLEVPEIITNKTLRALKKNQGWLVNIASVSGLSPSTHAAVYGSSKAGLIHFTKTIYEENRKYGLKAVCLIPDLTDTDLYRHADFTVSEKRDERLEPQDVADALQYVLHLPEGVTMEEIVIRPQKNRIIRKKIRSEE